MHTKTMLILAITAFLSGAGCQQNEIASHDTEPYISFPQSLAEETGQENFLDKKIKKETPMEKTMVSKQTVGLNFSKQKGDQIIEQTPALSNDTTTDAKIYFFTLLKEFKSKNGLSLTQEVAINGKRDENIKKLNDFIDSYPDSAYQDDAAFIVAYIEYMHTKEYTKEENFALAITSLEKIISTYQNGTIHEKVVHIASFYTLDKQWELMNYTEEVPSQIAALSALVSIYRNELKDYTTANAYCQTIVDDFSQYPGMQAQCLFLIASGYRILNNPLFSQAKAYDTYKELIQSYGEITYFADVARCQLMEDANYLDKREEVMQILDTAVDPTHYLNETRFCAFPTYGYTKNTSFMPPKWNKTSFTFFIEDQTEKSEQILRKAFEEWAEKTKGVFTFQETTDKDSADIKINMNDGPVGFGVERNGVALTKNKPPLDDKNAQSIIYDTEIALNQQVNENEIRKTALHEIGHALGLGHSFSTEDIMLGGNEITNRDIKTLELLYK